MAYYYLLDFVVNAILINVVVLAAEGVQNKVNCVRETLKTFPEGSTSIDSLLHNS